jgi:hypothetical protein
MSLQRSLQNGRKGASSDHSISREQVGHLTRGVLTRRAWAALREGSGGKNRAFCRRNRRRGFEKIAAGDFSP